MASQDDPIIDSVRELITSYHELNANIVDELREEPSPLEFMRYVARNRPFVVRNGAAHWTSNKKWSKYYLKKVMGKQPVNVALTPKGNADAVLPADDGSLMFVKPYETEEPFSEVLRKISDQELYGTDPDVVRYAQTQNDNLRHEYSILFADVPTDVPFARIALQHHADAINFWLGNSHSTTSLHKDNYENIYVQVLGQKHFVLLPPIAAACVNDADLPAATYVPRSGAAKEAAEALVGGALGARGARGSRNGNGGGAHNGGGRDGQTSSPELEPTLDEPAATVNWATWDPDEPRARANRFSELARPLRVTLHPGDMLYLPALWYHKVSQSCSEEGICCAVNYWYDLDFSGAFWSLSSFARSVSKTATATATRTAENEEGGEEGEASSA